jgi:mannose-6-phosphate isomerase-like protein (cupin superfamily)
VDLVRFAEAPAYDAPGHFGFRMVRLQGREASPATSLWIGLSTIEPSGRTELSASDVEKLYVLIEGEVEISNGTETVRLGPLDSCRIAPGEDRALRNPGPEPARLLLAMPHPSTPG